jgi:hypothetical protein
MYGEKMVEKYQFIISNVTIAAIYLRERRRIGDKRRTKENVVIV